MWTTVIGLIERWWREKPRRDVVQSVVQLRDAMVDCQSAHERHTRSGSPGSSDVDRKDSFDDWTKAVDHLANSLEELDTVLAVFSPTAHDALHIYFQLERQRGYHLDDARRLEAVAADLGEPLGIDLDHATISHNFREALDALQQFIATNFKPEEIYEVTNKWR